MMERKTTDVSRHFLSNDACFFPTGACAPGSYSDTGFEPCLPCPRHFYNAGTGATSCAVCADAQYTVGEGSTAVGDCRNGLTGAYVVTRNTRLVTGLHIM